MAWSATQLDPEKDPRNGNIIVPLVFTNGVETYVNRELFGYKVTPAETADKVAAMLAVYDARDAAFEVLQGTVGPVTPGTIPGSDPKQQAARDAQIAFAKARDLATIKQLGDPETLAKYTAFLQAVDDANAAIAVAAELSAKRA